MKKVQFVDNNNINCDDNSSNDSYINNDEIEH